MASSGHVLRLFPLENAPIVTDSPLNQKAADWPPLLFFAGRKRAGLNHVQDVVETCL
jgi:hypothetical protein